MTVLVTGGAGFIGRHLVMALVKSREDVRVLDDYSRGKKGLMEATYFHGDVRNLIHVLQAADSCDEVIHLASINGTRHFYEKPADVLEVGLLGICNVVETCKKHGIKKLMVMSSSEVYQTPPIIPTPEDVPYSIPDPFNPRYSYAVQKIASEMVAIHNAQHFENLVIVRPHNVYGPDAGEDHVIPRLARNPNNFYGGDETRAFIYIDDAIDGLMLLRKKGEHNNVYNLGTEEEVTIRHLRHLIQAHTLGPGESPAEIKRQLGGTIRRCPDVAKMRSLGFKPKVNLNDGLKRTVKWYRGHNEQRQQTPIHPR